MTTIYQRIKIKTIFGTDKSNNYDDSGGDCVIGLSYTRTGPSQYSLNSYLYDISDDGATYKELQGGWTSNFQQYGGYPWSSICADVPGRLFNDSNAFKINGKTMFLHLDLEDEYNKQIQAHPGQDEIKRLSDNDIVDLTGKIDFNTTKGVSIYVPDGNGGTSGVNLKIPMNCLYVYSPVLAQQDSAHVQATMLKNRQVKFLKAGNAQ